MIFPVRQFQNSTGRVVLLHGAERIVPVYGQLTISAGGTTYESPIGKEGEFYLENAPRPAPGARPLSATHVRTHRDDRRGSRQGPGPCLLECVVPTDGSQ